MGGDARREIVFVMTGAWGIPGGIAAANLNVIEALCELAREHDRRLSVLSFLEEDRDRPPDVPPDVAFRAFRGRRASLAVATLRAAARRPLMVFDYVGLAGPVVPLAASGLARTVLFAHGSEYWRDMRRRDRWAIESATLCLTNSEYTLKRMRSAGLRFSGQACPLGMSPRLRLHATIPAPSHSLPPLRAADGVTRPLGDRVLLLVGRMEPTERRKGHRQLLEILPAVLERHPSTQLVFVGPGADRELFEGKARELAVASSVFLPGSVSDEVLGRLYRDCYAFTMPSRQEGFGLAYLEAMNAGKPCLGCFHDGAEDVIVHGTTGLLVHDPDDSSELRGAVLDLLSDPQRAASMGRGGFERLHQRFTPEQYRGRIARFLRPLLET